MMAWHRVVALDEGKQREGTGRKVNLVRAVVGRPNVVSHIECFVIGNVCKPRRTDDGNLAADREDGNG